MKLFKLIFHNKGDQRFKCEDILLNPKDHPGIKKGDIVEIYNTEDEGCRLLLQVNCFSDDFKNRDTISVEQTIGHSFNLKCYSDVYLRVVDKKSVSLDSVEITFKDQYLGRSEMWRLKQYMVDSCVYLNKKVEYIDGIIRFYEMWSNGDKVACGLINEDTKIVFRSSTSMVYLFIQMSSEMWDFDIHGDLYFEKAVNGFLAELFAKWKKIGSNHEVTIVLFSRTFYEAKSLEEFPLYMRDCLQMDYKGRFYEDFYRVAIQNERCDDWSTVLVNLRRLFTGYQNIVLKYHERTGVKIPQAYNSTAAQGNFLEVLNISLNVFEKHYLDRSFDRTGQLSVVITPSVGVFEVDRELTNITKQRIIDNGVASDLVCVGEQPLHAVPLLKFHYKDSSLTSVDDYSMPHWINLSFYSTNKKVAYSTFIPRIRLPPLVTNQGEQVQREKLEKQKAMIGAEDSSDQAYIHNSLFDYDAYDEQIFQLPQHGSITCSLQRVPRTKKTSVPSLDGNYSNSVSATKDWEKNLVKHRRKMSDPDIHHSMMNLFSNISENNSPNTMETVSQTTVTPVKQKRLIKPAAIMRGRALINPFDPSHVTIKLTSNRRRWSHIFPKGPSGVLIQQHHYQAVPTNSSTNSPENNSISNSSSNYNLSISDEYAHTNSCHYNKSRSVDKINDDVSYSKRISICSSTNSDRQGFLADNTVRRKTSTIHAPTTTSTPAKSLTLLWGATGEQVWTPALTTGVDWKSLTIPACLPITTDFFPDHRSLNNDYVVSDYTLLPDDVNTDFMRTRAVFRDPLSTLEVFNELVSQRLAQGFQLIVLPEKQENPTQAPCCGGKLQEKPVTNLIPAAEAEKSREYLLSIGRIFHKISLTGSEIIVTRYRPRHPYPPINVEYRYRFHAPQHDNYEVSGVNFTTEKLENFHWNHMDQYICTRGDTDFSLYEGLKYWRYRMYLLPKEDPVMRKIIDNNLQKCDIYPKETSLSAQKQQIEEFLRLIETHLNKIKKTVVKRPRGSPTTQQTHLTRRRHSTSTASLLSRPSADKFRDRLGSNRLPEKFRPRSGSKIETRSNLAAVQATLAEKAHVKMLHGEGGDYDDDDCFVIEPKFRSTTPITEIFEAFKNPVTGVPLLNWMPSFPSNVFGSYDAIIWVHEHSEPNCNPLEILENMRKKKWICHASGDYSVPIIPGFYLYYIVLPNMPDMVGPLGDLEAFENEWCEVEVPWKYIEPILSLPSTASTPTTGAEKLLDEADVPFFLHDEIEKRNLDGKLYRLSHLEIDLSNKSERTEFGHCKYHKQFIYGHAFEITVQWIRASGPIVYDLIYNWSRKATQCGFQLVAIPADPMAEPFVEKSDPLRGPIFVPLNVDCLMLNRNHLFEEFKKDTWSERMLLFQDAIVRRFGFMPCLCETKTGSNDISVDWHFVHCTGNMFIMVPSSCHSTRTTMRRLGMGNGSSSSNSSVGSGTNKKLCNYYQQNSSGNVKENFITRHVNVKGSNGLSQSKESVDSNFGSNFSSSNGNNGSNKIGFLWQWNHMIPNKRWKSLTINQTDELFQLRMLRDFKDFCSNSDGRLLKFWDESWELKEKLSLLNSGRNT